MNDFDRNNSELWKWGIIYYNPNDDNLIVSKLSGLGWTVNFANRFAYLFLLGIIAVAYLAKHYL